MAESIQREGSASRCVPRLAAGAVSCLLLFAAATGGCGDPGRGPIVFYLDGAGWYGSAAYVEKGLRDAGYAGEFRVHFWSAFLGPAVDHFLTSRSPIAAKVLARRIENMRLNDPTGQINLMGLSASASVILSALEQLPEGVAVDNVVLFSPSVSAQRDLTKAMRHIQRNLYATCSPHDAILASMAINADSLPGPPAGRTGFRLRHHDKEAEAAYRRVVNLRWRPSYLAFDWVGSHTSVTNPGFVAAVVAPRMLSTQPYPLDRPVMNRPEARGEGDHL